MNDDNKPDIWQNQSQFDIEGLEKALSSGDPKIRQRAAAALRSMRNAKAMPALKAAFEKESDDYTRSVIAAAIEVLHDSAPTQAEAPKTNTDTNSTQQWIAKLQSSDSEEVIEAARQLGELGDKLAVEALIMIFNDPKRSIQVRLAVAEALLKLESAPVEVALLANLRHTEWVIRRNGAAILGQLKAEWAIQPLARALSDPHPVVRRTAMAALKYIGTPESRKALAKHAPNADNNNNSGKESPEIKKTVSGLDVKRPGKAQNDVQPSGMLKKLAQDQAKTNDPASQMGTRPLDSKTLDDYLARGNTQPINDALLDSLDALLDAEDKKESTEQKAEEPPKSE